jgi:hypothetical protein
MAKEHLEDLEKARYLLVIQRRAIVDLIIKEPDRLDYPERFTAVQLAIEAMDRAIDDELKTVVAS